MTTNFRQTRTSATSVAFVNCHDASTFGRVVHVTAHERDRLRDLLRGLQEFGLILAPSLEPARPAYGFGDVVGHLEASFGAHILQAALPSEAGFVPGSDQPPVAVMPVWAFEPEAGSEDVLLSSARLWGADLLLEALRLDGEEDAQPVAAVRQRFERWAAAAGGRAEVAPVRLPGRSGSYAVFASPASA